MPSCMVLDAPRLRERRGVLALAAVAALALPWAARFHRRSDAALALPWAARFCRRSDDCEEGAGVAGGHWERVVNVTSDPPYVYSSEVCEDSYINKGDCIKTNAACAADLMDWQYFRKDGRPYPKFDAAGFRERMRGKRIVFIGPSMMRQQVLALAWTLGHREVVWDTTDPASELGFANCTAGRHCTLDRVANVTICHQFLGSFATKVYHEGNFTLDHSRRGHGDSSCLLGDGPVSEIARSFDVAIVQELAWFTNLPRIINFPESPAAWVTKMLPRMYADAMGEFLFKLSLRMDKTVLALGQIGVDCVNKTEPEPFAVDRIPDRSGWQLAPRLWDTSLALVRDLCLDVQLLDIREPLMQSVHAHPVPDCLHFCMNSAAVNIYLDVYWEEVFSKF